MFYLDVPYKEKDRANQLGAEWDGTLKKWGVPETVDLEHFREWIPIEKMEEAEKIIESQKPEKGLKLSSLLINVKKSIEDANSGFFWINAEIANLQLNKSSHLYLQLIETDNSGKEICTTRAVIWKNDVEYIQSKFKNETGQELQKGLKVLIKAKVSFQIKHHLSLVIHDIDPSFTLGGMEAKVKQLRDRLKALNLYNTNKEKKYPIYFKNIAVVSPFGAAGLGDFQSDADLLEKNRICKFTYYTATFQGDTTSKSVSDAIAKASFDAQRKKFDAIVVIRGGGAKTDLHFLNEFDIAKRIAEAPVPVFTGIGHERDKVFIDEISNRSFDTPSKVIGFIHNTNVMVSTNINEVKRDIDNMSQKLFKDYKQNTKLVFENIKSLTSNNVLTFQNNINNLNAFISENLTKKRNDYKMSVENAYYAIKYDANNKIKAYESDIELFLSQVKNNANMLILNEKTNFNNIYSDILSMSPLNALNNGYAVIKSKNGQIITKTKDLNKEVEFIIMMQDGEKLIKNQEKKNEK